MNVSVYQTLIQRLYAIKASLPDGLSQEEYATVISRIDELIYLLEVQIDGVILDEIGHG